MLIVDSISNAEYEVIDCWLQCKFIERLIVDYNANY